MHRWRDELCAPEQRAAFDAYVEKVASETDIERLSTDREKTGVFLGRYAINPVNGERLPIWAADYVLSDYGTGAIMAVPAHDQRDLDFALRFDLPVRVVVDSEEEDPAVSGVATAGDGILVNSGPLDGLTKDDAIARIIELLEAERLGEGAVNYRLRDWLVSRQRFWGAPIPIVHCPDCGEVPVPEDQLPVRLPDLRGHDLAPRGVSPLAAATDWVNTQCPKCDGPAKRDSDTMDTFVDSSWYFLRYCSPDRDDVAFDVDDVKAVDAGCHVHRRRRARDLAHAVLAVRHQGAARHGTGRLRRAVRGTHEPRAGHQSGQGDVEVARQLASTLGEQIDTYGVDAVRLTIVFAGPIVADIDWADVSPSGSMKFLSRAWRLAGDVKSPVEVDTSTGDVELRKVTHRTVHESPSSSSPTATTSRWRASWSSSTRHGRRSTRAAVQTMLQYAKPWSTPR